MTLYSAKDVSVRLNGKQILNNVDFQAQAGEVTAIVGPNGSGKSTLIKALTDEVPWTGQVVINGTQMRSYQPWDLASVRGVLPQAATLAFPFTVVEVLRLGLSAGPFGGKSFVIEQALERVGLTGYANRSFQDLSGGEQQRAHLARVLCQVWEPVVEDVPRWLLLDEPVSSLDIGHQLLVMEQLREYARGGGGVITVMHDLNLTAMVADRIAVVANGEILASGPTDQVFSDETLSTAYSCKLRTNHIPSRHNGFVLPQSAQV